MIAWDAPGAGGSTDSPEDFGMDAYADCLAGFPGLALASAAGRDSFEGLVLAAFHGTAGRGLLTLARYAGWLGCSARTGRSEAARSPRASGLRPTPDAAKAGDVLGSADREPVGSAPRQRAAFRPDGGLRGAPGRTSAQLLEQYGAGRSSSTTIVAADL